MLRVHNRGFMYLCSCGFMCKGVSGFKNHKDQFRGHSAGLRILVSRIRACFKLTAAEFPFKHEDKEVMKVYTENPNRYVVCSYQNLEDIKHFLNTKKNFLRFVHNQKIYRKFLKLGERTVYDDKFFM